MASQVSARGQITIDHTVREALSVKPGMVAVQVVVGDHLEVYFIPASHERSLFGVLRPRDAVSQSGWDALDERAAQTIAAEA